MTLDLYQIYYKDDQLPELYDFTIHVKNHVLNHFFENQVIADYVPASDADYIGVASWRLRQKREDGWTPSLLNNDTTLTEAKFWDKLDDADIVELRPARQYGTALQQAANWHWPNWEPCINELKKFIRIPDTLEHVIYENHFIARKEVYHDYIFNTLRPCMEFIDNRIDLYGRDAGYLSKLRRDPQRIKEYKEKTGREDWPMTPFILERLFSIWIQGKGFKIKAI